MLKIANHGGKCCGIKTIHGFHYMPLSIEEMILATKINNLDAYGHEVSSSTNFFHLDAPAETLTERFDRYVSFIKERRPKGLIEVTLASFILWDEGRPHRQDAIWGPIIEERGFKRVSYFHNSNSANDVSVYHHAYFPSPVPKKIKISSQNAFPEAVSPSERVSV